MKYKEVSKAYCSLDIKTKNDESCDVNFNKSIFVSSMESSSEEVDDATLDLDLF